MNTARRIAEALAVNSRVEAVCLYGSVARGEGTPESDLDMLVTGTELSTSSRHLRAQLPRELDIPRLSLSYYPIADLGKLLKRRPSFAAHVAGEGQILFDRHGFLRDMLDDARNGPRFSSAEMDLELERLKSLEDVRQFNGYFVFCFAQLYAIGKAVVMLILARDGHPQYGRDAAFAALRSRYPERMPQIRAVEELKPFYDVVVRGHDRSLPRAMRDDAERAESVIAAIRTIAHG